MNDAAGGGGGGGTQSGEVYVYQDYDGIGSYTDVTVWGVESFGRDFCCVLSNPSTITIYGTNQSDVIEVQYLDVAIGTDLHARTGDDVIFGSDGDDVAYGGYGDDEIWTYDGNDLIYGEGNADEIHCGDGSDTAYGGDGADLIQGGNGDDWLYGNSGNDILRGQADDDTLYGGTDSDILCAGQPGTGEGYLNGDYLAGHSEGVVESTDAVDVLWVPSNATAAPTGSAQSNDVCGHTVHGSTWAGTSCSYTLTTQPTECPSN